MRSFLALLWLFGGVTTAVESSTSNSEPFVSALEERVAEDVKADPEHLRCPSSTCPFAETSYAPLAEPDAGCASQFYYQGKESHFVAEKDGTRRWPTPKEHTLVLTEEAQAYIYDAQHPEDCANAKFLLATNHHAGLGSLVHVLGQQLALALDSGRQLIMGVEFRDQKGRVQVPFGYHWSYDNWCQKDGRPPSLECFVHPVSKCTLDRSELETVEPYAEGSTARVVAAPLFGEGQMAVPKVLAGWFATLPAGASRLPMYRWWRAQSAAYILRLNERMAAEMRTGRCESFNYLNNGSVPRLNEKCFSVPVRHGDKLLHESHGVPFSIYAEAIEEMLQCQQRPRGPEACSVFVSSEDPQVFQDAAQWSETINGCSVVSYNQERGDLEQAKAVTRWRRRRSLEIREGTLSLLTHLECKSGGVGSRQSNWNRLIEELSLVWAGAVDAPYFDVDTIDRERTTDQSLCGW